MFYYYLTANLARFVIRLQLTLFLNYLSDTKSICLSCPPFNYTSITILLLLGIRSQVLFLKMSPTQVHNVLPENKNIMNIFSVFCPWLWGFGVLFVCLGGFLWFFPFSFFSCSHIHILRQTCLNSIVHYNTKLSFYYNLAAKMH